MRKRKPAVVWLPQDINNRLGQAPIAASTGEQSSLIIKILTAPPLGDPPSTEEIPIVKDFGGLSNVVEATQTLSDLENSGYRLRRIVGKLFFAMTQSAAPALGDVTTVVVTAAFIIRRIDPSLGTSLADPIGGPPGIEINVASLENQDDPFIWRRSWMLSNKLDANNTDNFGLAFNGLYGSAVDGPHVDQKTARLVGPDERLFLTVTCSGVDGNAQTTPLAVVMVGDLRVLASMRSSVGNRRNASR